MQEFKEREEGMKKYLAAVAILAIALSASARAFSQSDSGVEDLSKPAQHEPPMLGIHWARGFEPNFLAKHAAQGLGHRKGTSVNMLWHNGGILTTAVTENIFWGTSWSSYSGDKITGMDSWYKGFSNSNYSATSDEYAGTNGQVGALTTHLGHVMDYSAASSGGSTSAILAEVCKAIPANDLSTNGYYSVYTDLPRGNAGYCAWHSWGTCSGIPVQFAFFWNLDGDPGCNPQSTVGGESQGLAALANVSGHELSEARTDPTGSGWWDSSGAENGDKCAWTFNVPYVTFTDGRQWKIQGEWSNAAYTAGTGYPNSAGQKGCLAGQ
jgi:hypothetical protein